MQQIIKAAIFVKLAEHYRIPADISQRIVDYAQRDETEKVVPYLDGQSSSMKDREAGARLRAFRSGIMALNKGVQFDGDCATMIANFEQVTGKPFEKPAWLSGEMKRV